jgi:glycosyltransferase involved in cell wall biosynthesis
MRVVHINSYENTGGAARAVNRLHKTLQALKINSQLLVMKKNTDDPSVTEWGKSKLATIAKKCALHLDRFPFFLNRTQAKTTWSTGFYNPINLSQYPLLQSADIICLYWIGDGGLSIDNIRRLLSLGKPVVWRLSDMWAFTGGCHYSGGCTEYKNSCENCPQLEEKIQWLPRYTLAKKLKWDVKNLIVVCPSRWMVNCAKESKIFESSNILHIATGVDLTRFKPQDKKMARDILGISQDKKIILFGAMNAMSDPRKGAQYLFPALKEIRKYFSRDDVELVIFGSLVIPSELTDFFNVYSIGVISDDISLAFLYAACDLFVAPSTEDNLPNTAIESLACGTSVIGFNIGGMPDLIDHQLNGYLVKPFDVDDFSQGILWCLESSERIKMLSMNAREKAEKCFDQIAVARQYIKLYEKCKNND